ncbi:hypothetical protein B0T14DRAFT_202183 [Immersiella caudata]|uniref:Uncharacterized protein n=1 Tax=Immersiella caudata TaxID=314043 RepID=A0AA40BZK1_9PEZI|nr:hypothetical protein B0T14DRAFT_202183 [Immersiella caudata]
MDGTLRMQRHHTKVPKATLTPGDNLTPALLDATDEMGGAGAPQSMAAAAAAARVSIQVRTTRCRPWHLGILALLPQFRTTSTASLLWLGLCLHLCPRLATPSAVLCSVMLYVHNMRDPNCMPVLFFFTQTSVWVGGTRYPRAWGRFRVSHGPSSTHPSLVRKKNPHIILPLSATTLPVVVCTSCRSSERGSLTSPHSSRRALKLFASRPMRMRKPKPTPPTPTPMSASASCRTCLH